MWPCFIIFKNILPDKYGIMYLTWVMTTHVQISFESVEVYF